MRVHILHNSLAGDDYRPGSGEFDTGPFSFLVLGPSRWGRDEYLQRGGHDQHSADVIVAHSSAFQYDVLRMLRFILSARARAPWMVFVLLISCEEESELGSLPSVVRDHFSRYFQVARDSFSLQDVHDFLMENYQEVEDLVLRKRKTHFGAEIVAREEMDHRIRYGHSAAREYDFALSFSGAQRAFARDLANALTGRGCKVFFDEYETPSLLGRNLAEELYKVYSEQARYCVILVSSAYKAGPWTNQERRAALDKAISESSAAYILPIQVEDVQLPGLSSSVAYLKADVGASEIARILYEKLVADMLG